MLHLGCEGIVDDPTCRDIGSVVCTPPLLDFGQFHCRVFCELCNGLPVSTPEPTSGKYNKPCISPSCNYMHPFKHEMFTCCVFFLNTL